MSDFLNIDVEGHVLIEIDSMVYESPLELSDNDFFIIKRILGLPPANHAMIEDLDQIKKVSIKVFNILVLGIENGIVCNKLCSMQERGDKDNSITLDSKDKLLSFSWSSADSEKHNNFIKYFLEEDYHFLSINLRTETD